MLFFGNLSIIEICRLLCLIKKVFYCKFSCIFINVMFWIPVSRRTHGQCANLYLQWTSHHAVLDISLKWVTQSCKCEFQKMPKKVKDTETLSDMSAEWGLEEFYRDPTWFGLALMGLQPGKHTSVSPQLTVDSCRPLLGRTLKWFTVAPSSFSQATQRKSCCRWTFLAGPPVINAVSVAT